MEEVCDLIAKNWNVGFDDGYIEHSFEDDLNAINSNESAVEYIITQLNIYFGEKVYDIVSDDDCSMVSFKFNEVNFSIREWYHSRGNGFWVVEVM